MNSTTALGMLANPISLTQLEESLQTVLPDFSEEQQRMIGLLIYSIKRDKISTDDLGKTVVNALSNKSNKLNTIDEYKAEFGRLYQRNLDTVINNNQNWDYGGLKTLEIVLMQIALAYQKYKNTTRGSNIVSSGFIIEIAMITFGGPEKLYWGYIKKWFMLGLMDYGASLNFWWFDFNAFDKPGLARYDKILKEENENQGV